MNKKLKELLWELDYAEQLERATDDKAVNVNDLSSAIVYEKCLRDGLTALTDSTLADAEKLVAAYFAMRPFEEHDFQNKSPVLKEKFKLTDKVIAAFYKDMCSVIHADEEINFRTDMTINGAKFVIVALARSVLDKEIIKAIMRECDVSFKDFGKRKALENFIADCNTQGLPIIRIRA